MQYNGSMGTMEASQFFNENKNRLLGGVRITKNKSGPRWDWFLLNGAGTGAGDRCSQTTTTDDNVIRTPLFGDKLGQSLHDNELVAPEGNVTGAQPSPRPLVPSPAPPLFLDGAIDYEPLKPR